MMLHKKSSSEKRLHLVCMECSEPSIALRMSNSVLRMAWLVLAPIRSLRWAMAKRRTERMAPNGRGSIAYRAIDLAGW